MLHKDQSKTFIEIQSMDSFVKQPQGAIPAELFFPAMAAMLLGFASALYFLFHLTSFLFRYFLRPSVSFASFKGEWAVVTGASQGIGLGFVRRLAKRGMNVILIARSKDKLDAVAKELAETYEGKIQTHVVPFDFDTATPPSYDKLKGEIFASGRSVAVLINNAGVNVPYPTDFVETNPDLVQRMVRVNIVATNEMTRMVLPHMIQRKKGAIYMLSSAAGTVTPSPMLSVYGATKSYMDSFALSLSGEVERFGISVQSCIPFYVKSEMSKIRKTSLTVPSPELYADECLAARGQEVRLNAHWPHQVMASVLRSMPLKNQIRFVNATHADIQARALRKQQREQKNE